MAEELGGIDQHYCIRPKVNHKTSLSSPTSNNTKFIIRSQLTNPSQQVQYNIRSFVLKHRHSKSQTLFFQTLKTPIFQSLHQTMLNQTKPELGFTPHHFLNKTHKSFPIIPPSPEFDFFRSSSDKDSDEKVNPNLYISSQYYTFNHDSHSLMIKCILGRKLASSGEIQAVTPAPVLATWKSVRKDRCEGTAYVTAWKRIQEKLTVVHRENGNYFLCFGSNSQFVANTSQWQDIVMSFHCDDNNMKHFGVKDTIDRVRKVWTVGGKMYGIPESFIRACVGACRVCANGSGGSSKRRRFEYTESFDVSVRDVCRKLRQLAVEHKVVLCIRQKYIKYKPFMAEVKDYACHRAGEPGLKKSKDMKREPYASKRCGCGFRIRAIVPICDYNEKDKTFVYKEQGMAVFKLYAVHSGHEPGPLDGNARIMHRLVGYKGGFSSDQDLVYGISDEGDDENSIGNDDWDGGDTKDSVLHQVNELKHEVGLLEGKILKMQPELLNSVSQELFDLVNKVRNVAEYGPKSNGLLFESDLVNWNAPQNADLIEDGDDSFERTHGNVGSWDHINGDCRNEKDLVDDTCKSENWLKCNTFHEKAILDCEDFKIKPVRNDETQTETDADTLVGLQVDNFFPENHKWYDSSCGLDPGMDCGSNGFRLGEIV